MTFDSIALRCAETSKYSPEELQAAWKRMEAARKAKKAEKTA